MLSIIKKSLKKVVESNTTVERLAEWYVRHKTIMPFILDLEVSRLCNLKCTKCLRNAPSSLIHNVDEPKYCSLDTLKDIMEEIPSLVTLNFMGDGEPTMNPEFNDIIKYANTKGVNALITTNGTLLDARTIWQWSKQDIRKVHVSLDGVTKSTYEGARPGAELNKVLENIKLLVQNNIKVCINMVLTEYNIHEMPGMVALCKNLGVKEVTFLMPICTLGTDAERPKDNQENRDRFNQTKENCRALGVKWILPIDLKPMFRRLSFPFTRPQLALSGDLYSCCYMIGRGKTWYESHLIDIKSKDYILGNIFKEGFRKIWYGDDINELRTVIKKTEQKRGLIVKREELLVLRKISNLASDRFKHCESCLPRWGMACS